MNAKQKALELANRFVTRSVFDLNNEQLKEGRASSKKDAIVCVDEIIQALEFTIGRFDLKRLCHQLEAQNAFDFWKQVKIEIEALP